MKELSSRNWGSQKTLGYVGTLTMIGFACSEQSDSGGSLALFFDEGAIIQSSFVYFAFAMLFLVTALFSSLGFMQIGLFFLLSAIHSFGSATRPLGLVFAIVASLILLRRGWFFRRRALKAALLAAVGSMALLSPQLLSGDSLRALVPALIWAGAFVIIVICLAQSRLFSALAPRKHVLRLADYDLTKRQMQVVKLRISGKSIKQISTENDIAGSTVRNALSNSYRKLGIRCGEDLIAMGERYTVK
jgi:DNA-binding CsgD family transcriptional regulator